MDQKTLDKLPTTNASFSALRAADQIYVDKTALVYELASGRNRVFLSRPRRFGKSLLVSTFESLFKFRLRDFTGLAIKKLWEDAKTYAVLRLDFSKVGAFATEEEFKTKIASVFRRALITAQIPVSAQSYEQIIEALDIWLTTKREDEVVLLIDEYDAPLTQCLDNPELFNRVRNTLTDFYSLVKGNDACWRFVFITGIAKFSKMSVFSAMNNLEDISLDARYSALLGLTHDEIESYFDPYLAYAGQVLGLSKVEVLCRMTRHYDGFRFSEVSQQHVFSPWSALHFLKKPQEGFKNYWFDSAGQPRMLQEYFKNHSFTDPTNYGKNKAISISSLQLSSGVEEVSELVLMTHAGYLTIKNVTPGGIALGYPNDEVAEAIAQLYTNNLLADKTLLEIGVPDIKGTLMKDPAENIVQALNKIFSGINYNFYKRDILEEDVRAICQVLFKGAKMLPRIEHPNSEGRSDLEVTVGDRHLVFEFKVQAPRRSAKTLLAQAVKQLESREYGKDSFHPRVTRVAMVFSRTKHQFVAWKEVSIQKG